MTQDGPAPPLNSEAAVSDLDFVEGPPSGEEAEAQREEPVRPLIWIAVGAVLIIAFAAALFAAGASHKSNGIVVVPAVVQH